MTQRARATGSVRALLAGALLLALPFWGTGCASPTGRTVEPLRLEEEVAQGDPAYRASMRLVLEGLEADEAQRAGSALVLYERSLQVDPGNPWAYLALARHALAGDDASRALAFLDKADASVGARRDDARVRVHLVGLRGAATGDRALLAEAAALSPAVWGDGRLDAGELRHGSVDAPGRR